MEKVKLVSSVKVSENLTLRSLSVSEKPLMLSLAANNSYLVSTFSNGFRSVMSKLFDFLDIYIFPLIRLVSASGKVEKVLQLPKGIHNISAKPFTSSECPLF